VTSPQKDNDAILADEPAFMQAYARAREVFGRIPGVVDTAFGQKQTGGEYRQDIAIVVFVEQKRAVDELPADQLIPSTFEGYPTDVRVLRRAAFDGCDNTTTYDTIQGGIQISARIEPATGKFAAGTLGCIVRLRGDTGRENIYLLSNKHVLFAFGADEDDYIYHPFAPSPDTNRFQTPGDVNVLGPTQKAAFLQNVSFTPPGQSTASDFYVDCAIARIDIDSKCCNSTCTKDVIKTAPGSIIDLQVNGVNTLSEVRSIAAIPSAVGEQVFKVGRTTGRTVGVIRLINAPVTVPAVSGSPSFTGRNTIQIDLDTSAGAAVNCKGNERFTEEGDSGAVVVDQQGRVIGLHSLGAPPGSPSKFPSNACHIMPVLDILGICIPTTAGTSHGSCQATDGSGTAPAPASAATLVPAGSGPAFTEQQGVGLLSAPVEPAATPGLVALSDAERDRMLRLRDELRRTQRGRDLHEIFGQVRREVGYLVRNRRQVMIAWHRCEGPAFLAYTIKHLQGRIDAVPTEVNGVTRAQLLSRMARVLVEHGSNPLRAAIERYRDELMPILSGATTVHECLALLEEPAPAALTPAPRAEGRHR